MCRGGTREKNQQKIDILNDPVVKKIAETHKRAPSEIVLSWHFGRGSAVIVRSSNNERQLLNLNSYKFRLPEADISEINNLDRNLRIYESKQKLGLDYFA